MDVSAFYETDIQSDWVSTEEIIMELEDMNSRFWTNEVNRVYAVRDSLRAMNKDIRQAFDCLGLLYFNGLEAKRDAYAQVKENPANFALVMNQLNEDVEKLKQKQQIPLKLLRSLDLEGVSTFIL